VTNNYLLVFCNMLVNQVYRRASILLLAWLLPWTEQVACHMCACFIVCLLACLLADIADKHQDAGQRAFLQIFPSLAGGRSAYQHRYFGLNSVSCISSVWMTSSNVDNTIGYLKTSYMVFHILTLNFKFTLQYVSILPITYYTLLAIDFCPATNFDFVCCLHQVDWARQQYQKKLIS